MNIECVGPAGPSCSAVPRPRWAGRTARARPGRVRDRRLGLTLIELVVTLGIIALLFMAMMSLMLSTSRLNEANREQAIAQNAARTMLETARNQEFSKIFALYNSDPGDDPDGPGTAPGPTFAVGGLSPPPSAPPGMAGRIDFPALYGQLREDLQDPLLEMPHDLNGDGVIDATDHRSDYKILPVAVTVEWRGVGPNTKFVVRTRFIGR